MRAVGSMMGASPDAATAVFDQFSNGLSLPLCPNCGKFLKPDVVLFEEPLPEKVWQAATIEAAKADLMLVIGSSLEVYPACSIPQDVVNHGCRLIINNLTSTPLDALADVLIPMDAAECIPLLIKQLL